MSCTKCGKDLDEYGYYQETPCCECFRIIHTDHIYCPYCGKKQEVEK